MNFLNKSKIFKDVIHDSIEVTLIANSIIDTKIFQRLRNLHQLGVCYFVFINANHSRFEHSIGTYFLAGQLLKNIIINSDHHEINKAIVKVTFIKNYLLKKFNLNDSQENINFLINYKKNLLDDYIIELIKIAGLIHDLGHGPYSHLFDDWLSSISSLQNNKFIHHEYRSIALLKYIVDSTSLVNNNKTYFIKDFIDKNAFNFIAELINPTVNTPNNFIFQIISNNLNGLDVDKLDYLYRDSFYLGAGLQFDLSRIISHIKIINCNLCYPEKISYDIYKVYRTRYDLHKQYYNHKTVVSIEYIIKNILQRIDIIINISSSLLNNDLTKFIELMDTFIFTTTFILKEFNDMYCKFQKEIDEIDNYIDKLNNRKIYKCIFSGSYNVNENINQDLITNNLIKDNSYDINKIILIKLKIGLLGGDKNHPFDNLYFYDKNNNSHILEKNKITNLMSPFFQEVLLFIFYDY